MEKTPSEAAADAAGTAGAAALASPPSNSNSALHAKHAAWSGRFAEPVADFVLRYTASVGFDQRLAFADIDASLAHAAMLADVGVLSQADRSAIEHGLTQIRGEIVQARFTWRLDLEDVHLNIEARLTELIGDAGKRLHTGRSRNDQVATDTRLYLRAAIDQILTHLRRLQHTLVELAAQHCTTIMPGYTHLQVAQPVVFGHHLLAYVEMLERDAERLTQARGRVNQLPLGAGALAGTSHPIDRANVARRLGFAGLCRNSLDAVSDRDFAIEFCAAAALTMVHLSRFAEELVLWVNPRFAFISLPDRCTTGSSIMPQKRNPDVPELARGKTGRVVGSLMSLLMLVKAQPLAYNKDNQEDKEPLFDAVDTLQDTLCAFTELVAGIEVHPRAMRRAAAEGYATATDLADHLVRLGVPFRDAHEVVARTVRRCVELGCALEALPAAELEALLPDLGAASKPDLSLEQAVAARAHAGGTAPSQVRAQVNFWRMQLASVASPVKTTGP